MKPLAKTKLILVVSLVFGDAVVTGFTWLGLVTLTAKGYSGLYLFIPTSAILAIATLFFIVKVAKMSESQIGDLLNG